MFNVQSMNTKRVQFKDKFTNIFLIKMVLRHNYCNFAIHNVKTTREIFTVVGKETKLLK